MASEPFISIIVPVLDEAARIEATLVALRALRGPGVEVIVVDGGSRDATRRLAAPWAAGVIESARGRAAQMNAGAREARGDVLLFLHADTLLPDGALAAVEAAARDPGVVAGRFDVRFDNPRRVFRMIAWFMNKRPR